MTSSSATVIVIVLEQSAATLAAFDFAFGGMWNTGFSTESVRAAPALDAEKRSV
jgi:hypothetical protein